MTTSPEMRRLARQITELREAVAGTKQPQLAYQTLEAGAVTVVDEFDSLKGAVGTQFDGSVLTQEFNGPPPLTPTMPILETAGGTLSVRWDGLWTDGLVVPANFTRLEIHIQQDVEPVGDVAETIYGTFETPRGGEQTFNFPAGRYYVAFVARNASGARGPRSAAMSAVVLTDVAVTDPTGQVKATISDEGFVSALGASLDATEFDDEGNPVGGVQIYGRDFTDWINSMPRGVVATAKYDALWNPPDLYGSVEIGVGEVAFDFEAGRNYQITASGVRGQFTTAGNSLIQRLRYTTDGSAPTVNSPVLDAMIRPIPSTDTVMLPSMFWQNEVDSDVSGTMRVLLTIGVWSGTGHWQSRYDPDSNSKHPLYMIVNDMGIDTADVWQYSEGGAIYPANTTSASSTTVKKTYVKTYNNIGWGTYRSVNGAVRGTNSAPGDTGSHVFQGYSSAGSYNGDQRGLWVFPDIRPDIGSGTLTKLEIYAYATSWWYNSGGTARIALHGYGSVPNTLPGLTYLLNSPGWPKPGGRWITLPSSTYAGWKSGTYRGFGVGPAGTTDLTYYGTFSSAAQLRATIVK